MDLNTGVVTNVDRNVDGKPDAYITPTCLR